MMKPTNLRTYKCVRCKKEIESSATPKGWPMVLTLSGTKIYHCPECDAKMWKALGKEIING